MKAQCLMCYEDFDGESTAITVKGVDVCPTCRKHAEIGKRVGELTYIKRGGEDANYCEGWNDCLSEAKGPNKRQNRKHRPR